MHQRSAESTRHQYTAIDHSQRRKVEQVIEDPRWQRLHAVVIQVSAGCVGGDQIEDELSACAPLFFGLGRACLPTGHDCENARRLACAEGRAAQRNTPAEQAVRLLWKDTLHRGEAMTRQFPLEAGRAPGLDMTYLAGGAQA